MSPERVEMRSFREVRLEVVENELAWYFAALAKEGLILKTVMSTGDIRHLAEKMVNALENAEISQFELFHEMALETMETPFEDVA